MRVAYLRAGDVVTEVERIGAGTELVSSGPDLFPYEFIKTMGEAQLLLARRAGTVRAVGGTTSKRLC
jgi:hypothetical protein